MQINTYTVTVKKGDEVELIDIESFNESTAKAEAIDKWFYDGGWKVIAIKLKAVK